MRTRSLAATFLFLAAMAIPQHAKAPPPMSDMATLPGHSFGTTASYWLAPFVQVTEENVARRKTQRVIWYAEDGSVKEQVTGDGDIVSYGMPGYFVSTIENGQQIIHGVNEPWKRARAMTRGSEPPFITPDSRTFLELFHPEAEKVSIDVFIHGVLANTLGPFIENGRTEYPVLNDDGSSAMLVWKDAEKTTPQIMCAGPDGKLRFQVDCDASDRAPIPTPDGAGALIQVSLGNQNRFTLYSRTGKGTAMQVGPNSRCIGWVPGTLRSLFETSVGYDGDYHMIDWESGTDLWQIPCPGGVEALAIGITPKLVIFAVLERYKGGPWRGSDWIQRGGGQEIIRAFHAVRVEDGKFVARWQAGYPSRFSDANFEHFVQLEGRLYFVASDEFTELKEDDVLEGKNGWKAMAGGK